MCRRAVSYDRSSEHEVRPSDPNRPSISERIAVSLDPATCAQHAHHCVIFAVIVINIQEEEEYGSFQIYFLQFFLHRVIFSVPGN